MWREHGGGAIMNRQPIIPNNYLFKGYFIPQEIWNDTRLNSIDKMIASLEVNGLKNRTNKEISDFLAISPRYLARGFDKLKKLGYIVENNFTYEEIKEIVIKEKENAKFLCEWCGCKCNILNEHHYPIPKSKGGTETVKICPNCHTEFHAVEQRKFV